MSLRTNVSRIHRCTPVQADMRGVIGRFESLRAGARRSVPMCVSAPGVSGSIPCNQGEDFSAVNFSKFRGTAERKIENSTVIFLRKSISCKKSKTVFLSQF